MQNIREEERTSIAREIHDELGQQLTVIIMDVAWLDKKIENDNTAVKEKIKELAGLLEDTIKTVRKISTNLRPSVLDDMGLEAAMEMYLQEFKKRSGMKTSFKISGQKLLLPEQIKIALFRIFQESLTNVARHSKAKKVIVSLGFLEKSISMQIEDDGIGFNEQMVRDKKTLGLLGMKERTVMIGGKYLISGRPENGTLVSVTIPLPE